MSEATTTEQLYIIDRITIDPITDCWLWTLYRDKAGYGRVGKSKIRLRYNKSGAHQLSYSVFVSEISDGLIVLHSCRNRHCCNPKHLRLGTPADNAEDRKRDGTSVGNKGQLKGEANSYSKLTDEQVLTIRELYATGSYSHRQLGELFGVNKTTVRSIVNGLAWRHV